MGFLDAAIPCGGHTRDAVTDWITVRPTLSDSGSCARLLGLIRGSSTGRKSEIQALVNTTEKVAPPEFSIRVFGSVSVSGSQIYSLRTLSALWLTAGQSVPLEMATN